VLAFTELRTEAMAAFCTSGVKYFATAFCAHASTKTVSALTLDLAGLIRSFGHGITCAKNLGDVNYIYAVLLGGAHSNVHTVRMSMEHQLRRCLPGLWIS